MRRLINYCIIVLAVSLLFAFFFYWKLSVTTPRQKDLSALDYCINNHEYNNIIFIGGSRVQTHIDPYIIDSVTGLSGYDISIDGIGIVESNMLLNKYLQQHPKPKIVFLDVEANMFYTSGRLYNITDYFSYLHDTLIYQCLSPYKLAYRYKLVQYFYLMQKNFATTDLSKSEQLFSNEDEKKSESVYLNEHRGYYPRKQNWGVEADKELKNTYKVAYQQQGFDLLQGIINRCQRDSVRLVFLYSPIYKDAKSILSNFDEIMDKVKSIAEKNNIPYWDYSHLEISQSKEFFYNYAHLNGKGAEIFSHQLAADIKSRLQH